MPIWFAQWKKNSKWLLVWVAPLSGFVLAFMLFNVKGTAHYLTSTNWYYLSIDIFINVHFFKNKVGMYFFFLSWPRPLSHAWDQRAMPFWGGNYQHCKNILKSFIEFIHRDIQSSILTIYLYWAIYVILTPKTTRL